MNTNKIYERVTNTIIELLKKHRELDYTKSWLNLSGGSILAQNAVSGHTYHGINQFLLAYLKDKYGYTLNRWMTFNQLSKLEGKIRKGSKAAPVVFQSVLYLDEDTGKNITKQVEILLKNKQSIDHLNYKKIPYLKMYNCFNVNQIENLPDEHYHFEELEELTEPEKDDKAEQLIESLNVNIVYLPQNRAYYKPSEDTIYLPERRQFTGTEPFYNVIFHELGHLSGHKSRLNRPLHNKSDFEQAFEELIAELTSAFICAMLGFESQITNNASYIESWLSVMSNDSKFVIKAAAQAQKAADYIISNAEIRKTEDIAA